jgi:hypothetical protein
MVLAAATDTSIPWAAIVPFLVISLGFVAYCLWDLSRSPVRHLPKWAWALICLCSIPLGGIVYLIVGKDHR